MVVLLEGVVAERMLVAIWCGSFEGGRVQFGGLYTLRLGPYSRKSVESFLLSTRTLAGAVIRCEFDNQTLFRQGHMTDGRSPLRRDRRRHSLGQYHHSRRKGGRRTGTREISGGSRIWRFSERWTRTSRYVNEYNTTFVRSHCEIRHVGMLRTNSGVCWRALSPNGR